MKLIKLTNFFFCKKKKVEMLDWKFSKVEPVVEYTQGDVEAERMKKWKIRFQGLAFEIDNSMKLLKYVLSMKFALRNEIEALNCIITSDPTVFDGVFLGEKFPKVLDETTVLIFFFFFHFEEKLF